MGRNAILLAVAMIAAGVIGAVGLDTYQRSQCVAARVVNPAEVRGESGNRERDPGWVKISWPSPPEIVGVVTKVQDTTACQFAPPVIVKEWPFVRVGDRWESHAVETGDKTPMSFTLKRESATHWKLTVHAMTDGVLYVEDSRESPQGLRFEALAAMFPARGECCPGSPEGTVSFDLEIR